MKTNKSTRSAKVFAAECTIANPFLLCRVTAVYARCLQKTQMQFAESINQSLRLISDLPRGQMDTASLPLPLPEEEVSAPQIETATITL